MSPSNRALYITSIGWVIVWLRSCTRLSEFISTDWLSFQSLWSLCWCLLCRRDVPVYIYRVYAAFIQSPYAVMLLFEGIWSLSRPFLSYLDFACQPFLVQLLVRASYDQVLPHYTALLSTSCWMMGEFLNSLLPVDFIPLTSDHLLWDWNLESFWVPWDLQSSVVGSLAIDSFLGIHQCPLIDGSSQVFNLNTFIHTC